MTNATAIEATMSLLETLLDHHTAAATACMAANDLPGAHAAYKARIETANVIGELQEILDAI